jgi:hypothetical protein
VSDSLEPSCFLGLGKKSCFLWGVLCEGLERNHVLCEELATEIFFQIFFVLSKVIKSITFFHGLQGDWCLFNVFSNHQTVTTSSWKYNWMTMHIPQKNICRIARPLLYCLELIPWKGVLKLIWMTEF